MFRTLNNPNYNNNNNKCNYNNNNNNHHHLKNHSYPSEIIMIKQILKLKTQKTLFKILIINL